MFLALKKYRFGIRNSAKTSAPKKTTFSENAVFGRLTLDIEIPSSASCSPPFFTYSSMSIGEFLQLFAKSVNAGFWRIGTWYIRSVFCIVFSVGECIGPNLEKADIVKFKNRKSKTQIVGDRDKIFQIRFLQRNQGLKLRRKTLKQKQFS